MTKSVHQICFPCNLNSRFAKVRLIALLVPAFIFSGSTVVAEELATIVDFSSAEVRHRWQIVNDGVMGGLSRSQMTLTGEKTGVFEGTVSLENNGGFASVRTEPADFGLAGFKGLELRVRGDGKRYQLRLRTDRSWDGIAYRSTFETVTGEWTSVRIDFQDCIPSFRGRRVPDAPALDPSKIRQIGFLISDNQAGEFRLELGSIKAYR